MGLCVGDALGVPVEFVDRTTLNNNPVKEMRSYGTHNQPAGTWSDDTSMTLCLLDSLLEGIDEGLDYKDIMKRYFMWLKEGKYTPYGVVFDIGNTTIKALNRYSEGFSPLECGGNAEHDNGNGSLMRILPILFYLEACYGNNFGTNYTEKDKIYNTIHNISALTHENKRSKIACGIYITIASRLTSNQQLKSALEQAISETMNYYKNIEGFKDEILHFKDLEEKSLDEVPEDQIKSSGYLIHTLEAAIWCLLQTKSYKECVLRAVNLGGDTDTVAALAGGLAGLYYGYDNIPKEWLTQIARRDYIENLCNEFNKIARNSQIRREVIGQIFEYIAQISKWRAQDVIQVANQYCEPLMTKVTSF